MFDIFAALGGGMIANLLITILGLFVSVGAAILLYRLVFGPKTKDPAAGKFVQYANGQRFLPLSVVKVTYYSLAMFLLFIGIAKCITTIDGFAAIFKYTIVGNVVLRILFETVLAARKNAGLDTDSGTASEPKDSKSAFEPNLPAIPYQQPRQTQHPQYQPNAEQIRPAQPVQPMPIPEPAPAPTSVPEPAPAPTSVPEPAPAQPQTTVASAFCKYCGNGIKPGAKFCPFCGKSQA